MISEVEKLCPAEGSPATSTLADRCLHREKEGNSGPEVTVEAGRGGKSFP